MNNYLDLSNFTDNQLLLMHKEKKKEYLILIQSEKIATVLLNHYNESLYTNNYHYRVNTEYYLLQQKAMKKRMISEDNNPVIKITMNNVVTRLKDSKNELTKVNQSHSLEYSAVIDEIIDKIKDLDIIIFYQDGRLWTEINGQEEELNNDKLVNILVGEKSKIKTLI